MCIRIDLWIDPAFLAVTYERLGRLASGDTHDHRRWNRLLDGQCIPCDQASLLFDRVISAPMDSSLGLEKGEVEIGGCTEDCYLLSVDILLNGH